jgi:hypothetical protein
MKSKWDKGVKTSTLRLTMALRPNDALPEKHSRSNLDTPSLDRPSISYFYLFDGQAEATKRPVLNWKRY